MMKKEDLWSRLYKENIAKMIGVSYRYVGDRAAAEDIAHDSFLKAIEKSDSYRHLGNVDNWLMKINLNNTLDSLRNKNYDISIDDYQDIADDNLVEAEDISLREEDFTEQEILEIINSLPQKLKIVFNLHVIENYSHSEIAKTMNIGVRTSKRYLSEARETIKSKLRKLKNGKTLSIFPFFVNPIDKICKSKLRNLSFEPVKHAAFAKMNFASMPNPSKLMVISQSKNVIGISLGGIVVAGGISTAVLTKNNDTNQPNIIQPTQSEIVVSDTDKTDTLVENHNIIVEIPVKQVNKGAELEDLPLPPESVNETLIETPTIHSLNHSLSKFYKNGFCGLKDENEQVAVVPKYSEIGEFDEYRTGWAMVNLFGFKGFIDSNGAEIVKPKYNEIYRFGEHRKDFALVRIGDYYGFIDFSGQEIVPAKFSFEELPN